MVLEAARSVNVLWSTVARELFMDRGGKTESAKIGNAKQKSTVEFESLFVPETKRSPKKRSSPDFGAFSSPKHGSRHRFQGGGGGQFISRGGSCPLLPAPMVVYTAVAVSG